MPKSYPSDDDAFDPSSEMISALTLWDETETPINAAEILERSGVNAPRVKASDLVGVGFTINYYRKFHSAMNADRGYAYFAVIRIDGQPDLNTTVLGADNIVSFIDLSARFAPGQRIHMMFEKQLGSGGREYYVIK